jgi:hypothetical protein
MYKECWLVVNSLSDEELWKISFGSKSDSNSSPPVEICKLFGNERLAGNERSELLGSSLTQRKLPSHAEPVPALKTAGRSITGTAGELNT